MADYRENTDIFSHFFIARNQDFYARTEYSVFLWIPSVSWNILKQNIRQISWNKSYRDRVFNFEAFISGDNEMNELRGIQRNALYYIKAAVHMDHQSDPWLVHIFLGVGFLDPVMDQIKIIQCVSLDSPSCISLSWNKSYRSKALKLISGYYITKLAESKETHCIRRL